MCLSWKKQDVNYIQTRNLWLLSLEGITPNKSQWLHTWPTRDDQVAAASCRSHKWAGAPCWDKPSLGLDVMLTVPLHWVTDGGGCWWKPSSGHSCCCHMLWLLSGAMKQEALFFPGYSILKSKCCWGQSLQAVSHCTHKHAKRTSTINIESLFVHEYKS